MRKVIIPFVFFMIFFQNVKAQQGIPFYEHYLLSDKYLINPSHAGRVQDVMSIKATHTSQWADIEDSPSMQTVSMHARVGERLASGAYIFNDNNGATSLRGIDVSLAYHIPIGEYIEDDNTKEQNQFSFGLSMKMMNQIFDKTRWNIQHLSDPLLNETDYLVTYFNIGGSFFYNGIYGGVSVSDLPIWDNFQVTNEIEPIPTRFYFTGGYKIPIGQEVIVDPSVLFLIDGRGDVLTDLSMKSNFYIDGSNLEFGMSLRSQSSDSGREMLSMAPMVNLGINGLKIGYLYRFGLTNIYKEIGNGHMFSLGIDIDNPLR